MPAPKQHDTNDFVDGAMRLFWSRGYEGTSINDLVDATGINRGSIYASFDGKRDIFLAALARYDDLYRARFLTALERRCTPKEAIVAAFRSAAGHDADGALPAGCLVVNSAVELSPHDPEIAAAVDLSLSALIGFFRSRVEAAKAAGEVRPDLDAEAATTTLYALFLGLRVMTRSNAPSQCRDEIVRQATRLLE